MITMMLMIMIMTRDNPQTLNDYHDVDVVGDFDCDDHHEDSVQPQQCLLIVFP